MLEEYFITSYIALLSRSEPKSKTWAHENIIYVFNILLFSRNPIFQSTILRVTSSYLLQFNNIFFLKCMSKPLYCAPMKIRLVFSKQY